MLWQEWTRKFSSIRPPAESPMFPLIPHVDPKTSTSTQTIGMLVRNSDYRTGHHQLSSDRGIIEQAREAPQRISRQLACQLRLGRAVDHVGIDLQSELQPLSGVRNARLRQHIRRFSRFFTNLCCNQKFLDLCDGDICRSGAAVPICDWQAVVLHCLPG